MESNLPEWASSMFENEPADKMPATPRPKPISRRRTSLLVPGSRSVH